MARGAPRGTRGPDRRGVVPHGDRRGPGGGTRRPGGADPRAGGSRRGLRRSPAARLHGAALPPDRPAGRAAHHRLEVLPRHPSAVPVRGPQPHPARLDRRRGRPGGRGPAATPRHPPRTPVVVWSDDVGSSGHRRQRRPRARRRAAGTAAPRDGCAMSSSWAWAPPASASDGVWRLGGTRHDVARLRSATGGQAATSSRIETTSGSPSGISGGGAGGAGVAAGERSSAPDGRARHGPPASSAGKTATTSCGSAGTTADRGPHGWSSPPARGYRRLEVPWHRAIRGNGRVLRRDGSRGEGVPGRPVAIVGGGNSARPGGELLPRRSQSR